LARSHGRTLLRNLFDDVWSRLQAIFASMPAKPPKDKRRRVTPKSNSAAPRTIHRVRQEFTTSCGVAVVAMFARVSHKEALAVMFPKPRRDYGTWLKDLTRALDHFGVTYAPRWRRFHSWEAIPKTSLVKVRWTNNDGSTGLHWIVFQRRHNGEWQVIDPDPPRRRGTLRLNDRELARYQGISYLEVNARLPS
jgi:ABC-type bacteriocin/lantibiotic exporter with double-glycine peptidase domain